MKKKYFLIAITVLSILFSGCGIMSPTPQPDGTDETPPIGEIPLPTFDKYEEYLEYINSRRLPENFVTADKFLGLGEFRLAVFLDSPDKGNMYDYIDDKGNIICIKMKCLSQNTTTDIKQYAKDEYNEKIPHNDKAFFDYNSDLFSDTSLLICNSDKYVTKVATEHAVYTYLNGELYYISLIIDDLLYTIKWENNSTESKSERDGRFLLDSNNMISKMLLYSTATDGYNEFCQRVESNG